MHYLNILKALIQPNKSHENNWTLRRWQLEFMTTIRHRLTKVMSKDPGLQHLHLFTSQLLTLSSNIQSKRVNRILSSHTLLPLDYCTKSFTFSFTFLHPLLLKAGRMRISMWHHSGIYHARCIMWGTLMSWSSFHHSHCWVDGAKYWVADDHLR